MEPAQRVLTYGIANGVSYFDIAMDLSKINRRLYSQQMSYAVGKVDFLFAENLQNVASVIASVSTAGDTWTVHNAWKKAQATWTAQQRRARRLIGPSAKPGWEDFKVYLDDAHRAAGNETLVDLNGDAISSGEWDYSRLIWEADDASIDEVYLHLIGGNVSTTDWGLILGYQDSRATVQTYDPDLPTEYGSSMYALMAQDQDAVADEVADNMESMNDQAPYDQDDYVGNDTNADWPLVQQVVAASAGAPHAVLPGFVAQCGLMRVDLSAVDPLGSDTPATGLLMNIHLIPGSYKGVLAEPMGQ